MLQTPKAKSSSNRSKKQTAKQSERNGQGNLKQIIGSVGSTSKYQGWSVEGICLFNVLYDLITKLHRSKEGTEFEEMFLSHCEAQNSKKGKKKSVAMSVKYEAVRHDIWDTNVF